MLEINLTNYSILLKKTKDFDIIWKPILVGGIFNSINPSVYESRKNPVKEKLDYSQKDMNDWTKLRGIEINWPKIESSQFWIYFASSIKTGQQYRNLSKFC